MTTEHALKELEVFTSIIPTEALGTIRSTWPEAEPVLLEELDWRIEHPYAEDKSARFLYALFLCAELKSAAAFERYLAMARLPEMMLDQVLGDMLTESLQYFLAHTCCGRFDELKALMEDARCYEFARDAGLDALMMLMHDGQFPRQEMEQYCMELLQGKLENRPSAVWDAAISCCAELKLKQTIPLIKQAYEEGLTEPFMDKYEHVEAEMNNPAEVYRHDLSCFKTTEEEIRFYTDYWKTNHPGKPVDHSGLLNAPAEERRKKSRKPRRTGKEPGRNEPCPCGSGKKYKKCCIETGFVRNPDALEETVAMPFNRTDEWIMAGYYYERNGSHWKTLACWKTVWPEVLNHLPELITDPRDERCDALFNGYDFFSNWMQDVQMLIDDCSQESILAIQFGMDYFPALLNRFPDMGDLFRRNIEESLARLEHCCGKTSNAETRLEHMIQIWPQCAQGYVVLADLFSTDALCEPDIVRAEQLLTRAKMLASDCADWDVVARLEDLKQRYPLQGK